MTDTVSLALVGIGKIARDQHVPSVTAIDGFRLAATVSRAQGIDGVPAFTSLADMSAAHPEVSAVSLCTPPRGRLDLVREAVALGLDVMLEKPPAATLSEAEAIATAARVAGKVLFATWHSREAAAVESARTWLADRAIERVTVTWKEDVRVWHPGQEWIWEPGIGVFDPGINALSILTRILPTPLLLIDADLMMPGNRAAPITAQLRLQTGGGAPVEVAFDFDQRGPQTWDIAVIAGDDELRMTHGGSRLQLNGKEQSLATEGEYPRLYRRFAELLASRESEIDLAPFRLVADAFVLGRRQVVEDFEWT